MTQSTPFAQVANNQFDYLSSALCANTPPCKKHSSSRKFPTSSISLRLLLVMFLTLTVSANAWADYTITFKTGSGSEVTTKAAIINSGSDYVSSVSAVKTYAESDGLRYGSSSDMGYTTFTLSNAGQIKASKIIFQGAKYYSSDNSSLQYTITYTDASTTSGTIALTSTATDKEATLESSKTISKIDIRKTANSKKRFYVQGVKVVSAAVANHTVTFDAGSGSCSTPNFTQTSTTRSIDLPTATTTCEGWTFAGWCISSAGNQDENSTSPGTILSPGTSYTPSSSHKLYAVYTRSEDGASATTTESYGFEITDDATNWNINGPVQNNSYKKTGSYAGKINSNNTYITYKEKVNVTSFSFQFMRESTNNNYNVYIETSPDNQTWTAVETYAMSSFTNKLTWYSKSHTFDGKTALYVRFYCYNTTAVRWVDDISITYVGGSTTYYMTNLTCATQTSISLYPNFDSKLPTVTTTGATTYTVPPCTLSRTGYTFSHWDTKADGTGADYYPNDEITLDGTAVNLYAIWTPITYTITYELDGGTNHASNPENYTIETSTITLQTPNKDGHTFGGWYEESTFATQVTQIAKGSSGNITLYAKWEEIPTTCTITYDANGGEGAITDTNTPYDNGATVTVLGNYGALTKDGYAFTGWNTAADGSGYSYKAGETFNITTNTTLYAQWCEAHWVLVTNKSEIEDDTRIIIAAKDYNVALSTNQKTDNRGQATITKKYNTVIFAEDVQKLSLEVGISENTFALNTGSGYLYAPSSSANQLKTRVNYGNEGSWSISFNGVVARVAALGNTHNTLSYNKTSELFSCYKHDNTQKDVVIYKEVCKQDSYNVKENLSNATAANTNAKTVLATATSLTLNYSANAGYLLPETITVQMGGATLVSGTDYIWNQETGELEINVDGFYGNIDVTIEAEEDPCYTFTMSEVTATSTTNSITLTWTEVAGATGYNVRLDEGELTTATGFTHTFTGLSPKTTYNWEVQAVSAICEDSKTGSTDTQKETFTVSWSVNGNVTSTELVVDGESIQDTPSTPSDQTLEDCGVNKFMGWSEKSAGSTPQDAAYYDDLCSAADMKSKHTSVTGDKTFYAVFATAEETGGGTVEASLSFASTAQRTSWSKSQQVWTQNGVTFTHNKAGGDDIVENYAPIRCYKNSKITITHPSNEITKIVFDCNSNGYATALKNSIGTISGATVSNSSDKVTVSFTSAVESFTVTLSSGQVSLDQLTVTAGGGTITTYSNYVTNCCNTPAPTNGAYTSVSGTEVKLTWNGDASRYHITCANPIIDTYITNTSYNVSGLTECNEYTFKVSAYPTDGCESEAITITAQPFSGAKTVNYNYNGGSGSTASFTTSCKNQKIVLPHATRPGYTFNGWFDAESGGNRAGGAGEEYNPTTSPVTLHAQWTEDSYTLTHSGDNYTITENKTSIKSSETPFTLHYTCTGDYGLPATISIIGGGKLWTVGTDYTWEVAADKQSATLTINQTTITADVTITINVATRYTVTFVHNDKGVFSGSEAIEVLSSENTITLPTVTDVSCGFYDTFEGWIVSNSEYVESTTKPATVYAGGASYKVTGDCTFRALYSKCEGDATQVYRKVTSTGEVTDGTYILVANTSTPLVYSGHTDGKDYGDCISGLTADGSDFSSTLPAGAVPVTVAVGVSGFSIHNGTKFIVAGTSTGVSDGASYWQLTDGSQVNAKACPQGVLQPVNNTTYVLQKNNSYNRFKTYTNSQSSHVFLYKLIDKCTKYYSTNPTCVKPVGVHIVYNANAIDASMSCNTQDRTYKVESGENQYPELASQLQFCTNATREGYTLVGWNTQENGQGTTYNINQNYYRLPVSGELDGDNWITLNLYAVWKQSVKFDLGNATGGAGVPDAVVENGECVLPEPTAEQLGTIPCGYEFYAWSETSVNATQTKPALFMPGDTYTGSALTLYAVYRLCETGSNADLFSLSYTISGTKYYVGPVLDTKENRSTKFSAVTNENDATVFGMKSVEGQTYKSLFWVDSEGNNKYMYWKDYGAGFQFTSEEDDSYGWTVTGTTELTFVSTPYMTNGSRYLSADATEIGCPSDPKAVTQFTKEAASTQVCTYATNPECFTTATLQFITNGGILNYPASYSEINYQDLTLGTTVYLPTATFAGEWEFEGWLKGSALESQTMRPETTNFIEVELNTTTYSANATGITTFYAVYSKTTDDKQFDEVNGGTYKLYAIQSDDTKIFMPAWNGGRGTMSGVTTCAESGDYTITPGTGEHAGHYQITCGGHTLGVVGDVSQTDLDEVNDTWWNIEPSVSGKGTWRITVVGSSNRALSALSGSFGNYAISELNKPGQTQNRDMEIGECIYTEYTSTPENIPYITITGAPVKITSTNGERVYASTTVHIEAHNFTGERIIHLSATNGFGVDPVQVRTNGQGAYSGNVKVYYEPTTDGDGQTITTSVLTASQTGGTNAEKISQTFAAIQGRNLPANFVIAAKWDGHWYALPANCTSSLSSTEGLLIEVDDVDNPTIATAAPASAKYGLREVIPSRQTDHGQGVVFTERFAKDDKQFALYNGSNANIQVNAQYSNYAQTNPDKYEWIPTTSDFHEYTLTNASTGRNLGLTSGSFGAYTAASNQVRLLPATFYEPAPVQVLKWKANSVIVMYTGAEATATTQVGNSDASDKQTLADQKITHGIYELTTNQALTSNAGGALKINFGANTRVELEIPLIISGDVTASADGHDVVILENSKLTAAATKYSYKDVYVYGGGKLAIPDDTQLGVNNIILRAGSISTNGAGQEATYQYIYPQVELKGTLTSSVQNIRYEYVTDYDHWYHFVLPFDGNIKSITYPTEYYGDQVKLDNTGSWQIKRYDGATRATGNYDAWKDIEKDEPKATTVTAGKGYIYWGAPKKITANDVYDRPTWGIQRITMSVSAPAAKTAENGDKTISGLGSYETVANNSKAVNDQGWNLIGNPYMVNLTGLNSESLKPGKLVEVEDAAGNWTGQWKDNEDGFRYVTIPSDHFDTYTAQRMTAFTEANPMIAGRAFFVQLEGDANGVTFSAANRASLMPQHLAAQNKEVAVETGIILSNETMQDEVNFWIKDGKTNDYEYNADYPKTPNSTNFNIYGVHINGNLSWVATGPEYAEESMPIGYQVPAAGTYTLSISETYYSDLLDALYVTDHAMSPEVTVDLMAAPYEFSVNQAETNNERFTISVKLKSESQGPTTGLENTGVQRDGTIKFIYQDKIFILHHGKIYDATGKQITTINK